MLQIEFDYNYNCHISSTFTLTLLLISLFFIMSVDILSFNQDFLFNSNNNNIAANNHTRLCKRQRQFIEDDDNSDQDVNLSFKHFKIWNSVENTHNVEATPFTQTPTQATQVQSFSLHHQHQQPEEETKDNVPEQKHNFNKQDLQKTSNVYTNTFNNPFLKKRDFNYMANQTNEDNIYHANQHSQALLFNLDAKKLKANHTKNASNNSSAINNNNNKFQSSKLRIDSLKEVVDISKQQIDQDIEKVLSQLSPTLLSSPSFNVNNLKDIINQLTEIRVNKYLQIVDSVLNKEQELQDQVTTALMSNSASCASMIICDQDKNCSYIS